MTLLGEFKRVTRHRPCPVCGKPDWDLYSGPDDDPDRALCQRVESHRRWRDAGWLHLLKGHAHVPRPPRVRQCSLGRPDFADLAARFAANCTEQVRREIAFDLGVRPASLDALGVGSSGRAATFPMQDAAGHVIGIRLRFPDGRKKAVTGSRNGLFVPDTASNETLFIAEGPTDTAALLSLGFWSVGRPSCRGGTALCLTFVRTRRVEAVVVAADNGEPGRDGGRDLARALAPVCRDVRVVFPPPGYGDVRQWVRAGARAADVQAQVDSARPVRLTISTTRRVRR